MDFFHHLFFFVSHRTIAQYGFSSQHFEEVIFQQARPLKLLSNGGLWVSGEKQTKTGMLMRPPSLPRAFLFFALLHPRNLPEGPSVVEAFSSSSDVCGVSPAVAKASKLLRFTPSVSVHTRTHLD